MDPFEAAAAELDTASVDDARQEQLEAEADLRWLITEFRGRRVLRRLLESTGVFRSTFTGEAIGAAFNEGRRNVGLQIVADIARTAPAVLGSILTEERYD
jgi:hypothetical protein